VFVQAHPDEFHVGNPVAVGLTMAFIHNRSDDTWRMTVKMRSVAKLRDHVYKVNFDGAPVSFRCYAHMMIVIT
jgi:hypothetical protein